MSKNARLKIALTRTIVNFFLTEDLCAEEISIQGTLCVTADKSTIFVTQIAETIVDPTCRGIQDNKDDGNHDNNNGNQPGSHGNRRSLFPRHSYDSRGTRGDGNTPNSSTSGGNRRLSNHDNGETDTKSGIRGNIAAHPLQQLQALDTARNILSSSDRGASIDRLRASAQMERHLHHPVVTPSENKLVALTSNHRGNPEDMLHCPPTSITDFTAIYQSIASKLHAAKYGATSVPMTSPTVQLAHHHSNNQPPAHQPITHNSRFDKSAEDEDCAPSSSKKTRVDSALSSPDQPPIIPSPFFRDFRHFPRGPSVGNPFSHMFPHSLDMTKDSSSAEKKRDGLKETRSASDGSVSGSVFDPQRRITLKQEESEEEVTPTANPSPYAHSQQPGETSVSPASRAHSLCSPTTQPATPMSASAPLLHDRLSLPAAQTSQSKVTASVSQPYSSIMEKHSALSPGALGGSLPPMHMLQDRLVGQTSLPPLQVPPLSASWPPMGGITSPGLISPDAGTDSWMRKPRTKFSPDQLQALELEYQMDPFLSTSADKRADLAKKLNITEKNVQIWFQNQRRRRRAAAYSKMHYVFSGDHSEGMMAQMYPPATVGFSSTSSDGGGELALNMHPDDDDIMAEDEEENGNESEAEPLLPDAVQQQQQQLAANRSNSTEQSTNDQGKISREISRDQDALATESCDQSCDQIKENNGLSSKEANGKENDLENRDQGQGDDQGHSLKDELNVLRDTEGSQGKITNQSVVKELLNNNIDGDSNTNQS